MGAKNEYYNEYLKAQSAGAFTGTFEDYMSEKYRGNFAGGKWLRDEPSEASLDASFQNWTEVARYYYGDRLDPVQTTKMALALQEANKGVNQWHPGQTINLPSVRAGFGIISDDEWAQQLDREFANANAHMGARAWGTFYDWEGASTGGVPGPTAAYWAEQSVTRGGNERPFAQKHYMALTGSQAPTTLQEVQETLTPQSSIPSSLPSNIDYTLYRNFFSSSGAQSSLGPVTSTGQNQGQQATVFTPPSDSNWIGLLSTDPKAAMIQWIADNPPILSALQANNTSMFTATQLALLTQLGIWEPPSPEPNSSLNFPVANVIRDEISNTYGYMNIPLQMPYSTFYMPTKYRSRSVYWGLLNWRV